MAREDLELWLVLEDPECARQYVKNFDWDLPPAMRPDKIILDNHREILFKNMTDEEAVLAAITLLRDVEVPLVMRAKNLERWEH